MFDIVIINSDNTYKNLRLNSDGISSIISAFKFIDIKKEFKDTAKLCIFHSLVGTKETTNYYQLKAKQFIEQSTDSNLKISIEQPNNNLKDYYIVNMTKGIYFESEDITPLILLCFVGNEYLSKPYRGIFEELIGEWAGDVINIIKKTDYTDFIHLFEKQDIFFDLGD